MLESLCKRLFDPSLTYSDKLIQAYSVAHLPEGAAKSSQV